MRHIFAAGAILAAFLGGFSMGRDVNAGELKDTRAEAKRSSARIEDLLSKLRAAQGQVAELSKGKSGSAVFGGGCVVSITIGKFGDVFQRPSGPQRACVPEGQTTELYSGSVAISVVAVDFSGEPRRDRVTGVIAGRSSGLVRFRDADVGTTFAFRRYRVRIDSVDTFSATFVVWRRP